MPSPARGGAAAAERERKPSSPFRRAVTCDVLLSQVTRRPSTGCDATAAAGGRRLPALLHRARLLSAMRAEARADQEGCADTMSVGEPLFEPHDFAAAQAGGAPGVGAFGNQFEAAPAFLCRSGTGTAGWRWRSPTNHRRPRCRPAPAATAGPDHRRPAAGRTTPHRAWSSDQLDSVGDLGCRGQLPRVRQDFDRRIPCWSRKVWKAGGGLGVEASSVAGRLLSGSMFTAMP